MTIKLTILGCGGSAGVPMIGGRWGECDPMNPKNRRTRASAMLQKGDKTVIIDTGPDFRQRMNDYAISKIDAVLYTHFHGDHINGFEELRYYYRRGEPLIPLYAEKYNQERIKQKFPHMFHSGDTTGFYPLPIEFKGWEEGDIGKTHDIAGIPVRPLPMHHGDITSIGYRVGDAAYCTDLHEMTEEGFEIIKGVHTMVIDCNNMFHDKGLQIHLNFDGVQKINERVQASRVILTHLKTHWDYEETMNKLPKGYEMAYDGLEIGIQT